MTAREIDHLYVYTNSIRKNCSITIIYPEEKIPLKDKSRLRASIQSTVTYYKSFMEQGLMTWNGDSLECRAKQMKNLLERHFYIDYTAIPERVVTTVIEDMI